MDRTHRPDLQKFLDRLTLRSTLSTEERDAISGLPARPLTVERNRDHVHLGERVDHACLVVDGLMARFDQTGHGSRQITALYVPGDMPDLHSVVRPARSSGLQALCETNILRIPHVALRSVANRFPALAEAFWRDCVLDAAILSQWIVNIGRRDARSRVAHLLCEMALRIRGSTGDGRFRLPISQAHLADANGLTSVHVNRVLKALREDGLVEVRGAQVTITDWAGLARVGEFDPDYLWADATAEGRTRLMKAG